MQRLPFIMVASAIEAALQRNKCAARVVPAPSLPLFGVVPLSYCVVVCIEKAWRGCREWAAGQIQKDPTFFTRLAHRQTPDFLWIGCADARAPVRVVL